MRRRIQDLGPAAGEYSGTVLLSGTHQSFAMNLSLSRLMYPRARRNLGDRSESVSIPVLTVR